MPWSHRLAPLTSRPTRPTHIWTLGSEGFVWNFNRLAHSFEPTTDKLSALLGASDESRKADVTPSR